MVWVSFFSPRKQQHWWQNQMTSERSGSGPDRTQKSLVGEGLSYLALVHWEDRWLRRLPREV